LLGAFVDIVLKNDVYHLSGRLDEFAEFDTLVAGPDPLKLNLGKLQSINSIGIRKFLAFTLARAKKKSEFYECTADFIANANVIPQMLGLPSDASQIKTFYVPFSCESCKRVESFLYELGKLKMDAADEIDLGKQVCSKCGDDMELDVEKTEFFMFLTFLPKK
jgi:hypothetical protein